MEDTLLTLLILISVTAALIILLLLRKSEVTKNNLRTFIVMAETMAGSQPGQKYHILPEGEINELGESLKILSAKFHALADELGSEKEESGAILSAIGAGVLFLNKERQVTRLNDTAASLFKITPESAIGEPFINLSRDHEMDKIAQRCLETNQNQTGTVQPVINKHSKQYFEMTAVPLSNGALILIQDLTNLRRLEKTRQDFIANISHELRTPIASCKAIVETFQNGAINDKSIADDFLQRMHVETDKLAQMVNELGELSHIESGELDLRMETVNVAGVIARATDRLKAQADRSGVSINLDVRNGLPGITGDSDRIEQVLVNLVHNAIKFTPEGGSITISSNVRDDKVSILVHDTGIGIPEEDLPHIFERFYKVDKARSSGGTGLGLAIAKHIIQAHGGDISVESEEGKGSTFILSLPVADS